MHRNSIVEIYIRHKNKLICSYFVVVIKNFDIAGIDIDGRREMITKMFQRADCAIKRYIDFCKELPRFDELAMEDQIALIKGTWKNIQKDRTYLIFGTVETV